MSNRTRWNRETHSSQSRRKAKNPTRKSPISSGHAEQIAAFHALEKRLARATEEERPALLEQQQALGGLAKYQAASKIGARHGESSRWLMQELEKRHGRRETRILDVGAIDGKAYKKFRSVVPVYIDIQPQAFNVLRADFLEFDVPDDDDDKFDVVSLSLVINFVGNLQDRAQMLKRAHLFLKPGGYLCVVLPLACLVNSRYIDHQRFTGILNTLGWKTVAQHDTARLTHWLLTEGEPDNQKWPRREVRGGARRNNFVIIVK